MTKLPSVPAVKRRPDMRQTDPSPLDRVMLRSACLPASTSPKSSDEGVTDNAHFGCSSGVRPHEPDDKTQASNGIDQQTFRRTAGLFMVALQRRTKDDRPPKYPLTIPRFRIDSAGASLGVIDVAGRMRLDTGAVFELSGHREPRHGRRLERCYYFCVFKVSQDPRAVAERLRSALDLMEAGTALMRQRMRREHPGLSADELDALMARWLRTRPADAPGRLVSWPRSRS
jgi:hypothetical protein